MFRSEKRSLRWRRLLNRLGAVFLLASRHDLQRNDERAEWQPYQGGTLAAILPLAALVAAVADGANKGRLGAGTAIMCGTFPVLSGGVRPARFFRMEMIDERLGRRIEHTYEMVPLPVVA